MNHIPRSALVTIFVLLVLPVAMFAQTGSISGTITDPAGAVVAGASVTARNMETNSVREVTSSTTGTYFISNLPVGEYEITVQGKGFKMAKASLNLTVAQAATLNVKMEVGSVSTEVEVSALAVAPVELENAQISNIVDESRIENLPMLTRDPYALVLLSPGTVQTNTYLGGFSVNGSRERNNNFLLDGTDNNDTSVPGGAYGLTGLNPEATKEFRVITNNFMPEFGRNTGAIIDIVTKSGTNSFHGEGHWFGRYNALGARDYFNNFDEDGTKQPQNPYVRNIFGYSVGGPVRKDKTFFFFANEFSRFRTTLTNQATVPTAAFKSGVFTYNGVQYDLTDPAGENNLTGLGLDPMIQNVLALYPTPNGPDSISGLTGLYYFPSKDVSNYYNLTARVDHKIADRQNLSLRYAYNRGDVDDDNYAFLPGLGGLSVRGRSHSLSGGLTSVLSNTLVNDFKASANRSDAAFGCLGYQELDAVTGVDVMGFGRDFGLPGISDFACSTLGDSNGQARRTGTYSVGDTLNWAKGNHNLKIGGDARWVFDNGYDNFFTREYLSFFPYTTFGVNSIAGVDPEDPAYNTIQDMGWMLTGVLDTQSATQNFDKDGIRVPTDFRKFRMHEYSGYIQDSWKIRPTLTLNLGVRYQFNGVPYEVNGNFSNLFGSPSGVPGQSFTFELAGPGTGRNFYNNDLTNFEPRIGFAWDPFGTGKTSIRGGWGLFHDRVWGNLFTNSKGLPPFTSSPYNYVFDLIENTPFLETVPPIATIPDGYLYAYPSLVDVNLKNPRSMNWNFGIQHELADKLTMELNYVGSRGDRLFRVVDGNPPDPVLVKALQDYGIPNEYLQFGLLFYGTYYGFPFNAVENNAFFLPFVSKSIAKSNYNSLQASLKKRMSHGMQFQASYTWSHSLDDGNDPLAPGGDGNNATLPRDSRNLKLDYGNSDFDVRHRFSINYMVELPFGRGKRFASNGALGKILEAWQISGITSVQTGLPYEIFGTVDNMHTGRVNFAYLIGNPTVQNPEHNQTGPNPDAFDNAPWGVPSNIGKNHFYGPGYFNFDAVLAKKIKFTESMNLDLRFEFYNLFNTTHFAMPNPNLTSDRFGFSDSTIISSDGTTSARQIQIGLKLNF